MFVILVYRTPYEIARRIPRGLWNVTGVYFFYPRRYSRPYLHAAIFKTAFFYSGLPKMFSNMKQNFNCLLECRVSSFLHILRLQILLYLNSHKFFTQKNYIKLNFLFLFIQWLVFVLHRLDMTKTEHVWHLAYINLRSSSSK